MTYPYVVDAFHGTSTVGTTHTIPLPSGAMVGDRIIVALQFGGNPTTPTWPAGWESLVAETTPGTQALQEVRYREVDGTEGSSINVTIGAGCSSASATYVIRGHDPAVIPVADTSIGTASSAPNAPDPPSLTSGFGVFDTLWLAIGGGR